MTMYLEKGFVSPAGIKPSPFYLLNACVNCQTIKSPIFIARQHLNYKHNITINVQCPAEFLEDYTQRCV